MFRTDYESTEGDDPAALGNRIAEAAIAFGSTDGALEDERYVDSSYQPANEPMVVEDPGAEMNDPNAWQPLSLGEQIAQNGLPIPGKVQTFIGPQWGYVTPFALEPSPTGTPIDPGPPPRLGDPEIHQFWKTYQQFYEFYGRSIELETYVSTGLGVNDEVTARADAVRIARTSSPSWCSGACVDQRLRRRTPRAAK